MTGTPGREDADRGARSLLFDPADARGPEHEHVLAAVAGVVDDADAFMRVEATGCGVTAIHRLRGSERRIVLRHATKDLGVLDEVFVKRLYEPPPTVRGRLSNLGRTPRILDLGANIGLTAVYLLDLLGGAELVCFEPDPANARVLERCLAMNADTGTWRVVRACAGARAGEVAFAGGGCAASQIVAAGTPGATAVPVADVLPEVAGADLVKLDIEGGEWEVLEDPRLAAVPPGAALVAEYHAHLCPGENPRRCVEERLVSLGFRVEHLFERDGGELGMLWAWRD